ncbi:hypothetical protein BTZ20_0182 [Rhodococcus sp. MTM3W5.2]|nr:hypothetical protein BTZ20_0182 [Rhodococcus sp. MTM3W5.2]
MSVFTRGRVAASILPFCAVDTPSRSFVPLDVPAFEPGR